MYLYINKKNQIQNEQNIQQKKHYLKSKWIKNDANLSKFDLELLQLQQSFSHKQNQF